jgi:hypothetical protein
MWHAARQLPSWLIFDVGRGELCISVACGEDNYMSANLHAFSCGVRTLLLHPRGGISSRADGLNEASRGSICCVVRVLNAIAMWRIRASLPRSLLRSVVSERVNRRHSMTSFGRAVWPNKAPEPTPTAVTPRAMEGICEMKKWIASSKEARVVPAAGVAHL